MDFLDASSRYREEEADNKITVARVDQGGSAPSSPTDSGDDKVIVAWEEMDPENPYNWSNVGAATAHPVFRGHI